MSGYWINFKCYVSVGGCKVSLIWTLSLRTRRTGPFILFFPQKLALHYSSSDQVVQHVMTTSLSHPHPPFATSARTKSDTSLARLLQYIFLSTLTSQPPSTTSINTGDAYDFGMSLPEAQPAMNQQEALKQRSDEM